MGAGAGAEADADVDVDADVDADGDVESREERAVSSAEICCVRERALVFSRWRERRR